jgi:hypothetical protein
MSSNPRRGTGQSRRPLLARDIERANKETRSAAEAAEFLGVHYTTYKKYAMMYGLFEEQKNPSGKGIPKVLVHGAFGLQEIFDGKHPNYDRTRLKERLLHAGLLPIRCNLCTFSERRVGDGRCPLVLDYKDGDRFNLTLENLQVICLNCCYLTTGVIGASRIEGLPFFPATFDRDVIEFGALTDEDLTEIRTEVWDDAD